MLSGASTSLTAPTGPKLLEYNADTPTALLETAVQWRWARDVFGDAGDQFNNVHQPLVDRWKELAPRLPGAHIHFLHTCAGAVGRGLHHGRLHGGDRAPSGLLWARSCPSSSSPRRRARGVHRPGGGAVRSASSSTPGSGCSRRTSPPDAAAPRRGRARRSGSSRSGRCCGPTRGSCRSSGASSPTTPTSCPPTSSPTDHTLDQLRAQAAAVPGGREHTDGVYGQAPTGPKQGYGDEGHVVQPYADLGDYDGAGPVLGAWVVDMEPAGLGIRESDS